MPVKARANIGSYCPKNKRTPVIGHAANNGRSSVIYKFSQNNFLSTAADAVHAAHPFHLVGGFERFGHIFLPCHIGNDDCHTNRCALGDGALDIDTIIRALYLIGYNNDDSCFVTPEPLGPGGDPYPAQNAKTNPAILDKLVFDSVKYFRAREEELLG